MKIYKTQEEVMADVKNKVLTVDDNVSFEFSFNLDISLQIAGDIVAWNINARNINAGDINARNINAGDITYYAFCCVYESIRCSSIKARREKHYLPICLDGELVVEKGEAK